LFLKNLENQSMQELKENINKIFMEISDSIISVLENEILDIKQKHHIEKIVAINATDPLDPYRFAGVMLLDKKGREVKWDEKKEDMLSLLSLLLFLRNYLGKGLPRNIGGVEIVYCDVFTCPILNRSGQSDNISFS